jgi:Ca2+-transporting ATPase
LMLYVPALIHFFKFQQPQIHQLLISLVAGFFSVIWVEFYKYIKRRKNNFLKIK